MRPKLIATDLDGTFIGRDLEVSERNRRAVQLAHDAGVHFVMATGRMYRATLPYARACGVKTPLITYQGALIRDHLTEADLWHRTIPMGLARETIEVLRGSGFHLNLYVDDELIVERMSPEAELYSSVSRIVPKVVPSLEGALTAEPTKIVAIAKADEVQKWVPALRERFGDRLYVTESIPIFLEIANPTIRKSVALEHVAERLGVSREEIVAFGDGMNDLDMLAYAGLGVAMGNAPDAVKAVADRVTHHVREDGVARVIEELLS
ncbi:MAG TPA: Cof-type HAD-IIB family hydrolase [Pantanalinema sp.]